jgi:hypothetical protein
MTTRPPALPPGCGFGRHIWKSPYVLATKVNAPKAKPHWHREFADEHRDYADSLFNATEYLEEGQSDTR